MNSETIMIISVILKYVLGLILLFIFSTAVTNIAFRKIVYKKMKKTRPTRV